MLNCESASRTVIPAFRIAVARRLVREYGFSQSKVASVMGVRQASVSNYLSILKSAKTERLASYISYKRADDRVVRLVLSGAGKQAILAALERAAADPKLVRGALSAKGLQLTKKSKSERV